jgi:hypothetical protein
LSKHKINTENTAFAFNKPSPTSSFEFIGIDKPKEIIKKNKPLNKNTEILEFFFNQKDINNNNNKNNSKTSNIENIFNPKNMEYTTPPKPIPQILASDSQVIIPSSVPSFHLSPYMESPSSTVIYSFIVDSNTTIQTSNISETFKLILTPLMSLILSENQSTPIAISSTNQKNQ